MTESAPADRQLPLGGEIFLDHVGHFVRDPQAASRALARAGFAPTPMSVQTQPDAAGAPRLTGTGNVTAMLTRGYVEVLFKTADTPLGAELDAAMARYDGIHLVALSVADAGSAHQRLQQHGFRVQPLVDMRSGRSTREASLEPLLFTIAPPGSRARCQRVASSFSPIAPSRPCGSRVGSRIPTAQPD